jgi:methionyl-tRNA formyltransferase
LAITKHNGKLQALAGIHNMQKRIAILCSDDAHHQYLISVLQARFNVVGVIIEPAANQRNRLLRNKRYKDYAYNIYHKLRREYMGLSAYRRHYFALESPLQYPPSSQPLVVNWINDSKVVELLERVAPDLSVVMGTGIIRSKVLECAGEVILNIHGGYLPDYKGNHCFFFAVYDGAFDKIGSTIHFVNRGIDTGDIVEVVVPPIYPIDSVEALYCRAEKMAVERLVKWIDFYEQGGTIPRATQLRKGKLYRTRDRKPHHDIILALRRLSGRLVLPARPLEEREIYADQEQ